MQRRKFITLLGGAAAGAWPLAANSQQPERVRHIGILLPATANEMDFQTWLRALRQALAQLDWTIGRNVGIEVSPLNVQRDGGEIERIIAAFARAPNAGLILTASGMSILHHDLIITLAARHKLPAVYYERFFVAAGGLISYGPNRTDQFRRAAGYVDRILKGGKPADLPGQAPTKFQLA